MPCIIHIVHYIGCTSHPMPCVVHIIRHVGDAVALGGDTLNKTNSSLYRVHYFLAGVVHIKYTQRKLGKAYKCVIKGVHNHMNRFS